MIDGFIDGANKSGIEMKTSFYDTDKINFDPMPVTPVAQRKTFSKTVVNGKISRLTMKRNSSFGNMPLDQDEAKVLVIYTGGTIGMTRNDRNGELYAYKIQFYQSIKSF